jgi:hypothetical protein
VKIKHRKDLKVIVFKKEYVRTSGIAIKGLIPLTVNVYNDIIVMARVTTAPFFVSSNK